MHACIYSRTIAVPAFFVEFDPTLNKAYLILSYLNDFWFSRQHRLSLTLDIWAKESIGLGKCT